MMFPEKLSMSSSIIVIPKCNGCNRHIMPKTNVLNSTVLTVMMVILFGDVKVAEKQQDLILAQNVAFRDLKENG